MSSFVISNLMQKLFAIYPIYLTEEASLFEKKRKEPDAPPVVIGFLKMIRPLMITNTFVFNPFLIMSAMYH